MFDNVWHTNVWQIYLQIYTKIANYIFVSEFLVVFTLWGYKNYHHQKMIDSQDVSQDMRFNVQDIRD